MAEQQPLPVATRANPNSLLVAGVQYNYAEWSAYTHDPLASLAAGSSLDATIQIDKKSDFEVFSLAYMVDLAGAAQLSSTRVVPLVRAQFNDSGSQQNWFLKPVPLVAIAGEGAGLPSILLQRRIIFGNSSMSITYTNYSAATPYTNMQLVLVGRKLYGGPVRG
jgi:hypothetical protein